MNVIVEHFGETAIASIAAIFCIAIVGYVFIGGTGSDLIKTVMDCSL